MWGLSVQVFGRPKIHHGKEIGMEDWEETTAEDDFDALVENMLYVQNLHNFQDKRSPEKVVPPLNFDDFLSILLK